MENIAGYVLDHTARDEARWHGLPADERGPFLVSALHSPRRDALLRLARLQCERIPGCDPFDGHEHGLDEVARWIGNRALAVRFVGLGVILGLFELTPLRAATSGEGAGATLRGAGGPDEWRFRLKGARPTRTAPEAGGDVAGPEWASRRPGPRRPRYVRCRRPRAGGFYACDRTIWGPVRRDTTGRPAARRSRGQAPSLMVTRIVSARATGACPSSERGRHPIELHGRVESGSVASSREARPTRRRINVNALCRGGLSCESPSGREIG